MAAPNGSGFINNELETRTIFICLAFLNTAVILKLLLTIVVLAALVGLAAIVVGKFKRKTYFVIQTV